MTFSLGMDRGDTMYSGIIYRRGNIHNQKVWGKGGYLEVEPTQVHRSYEVMTKPTRKYVATDSGIWKEYTRME